MERWERGGDGQRGRVGDGKRGKWGEFFLLASSFLLLPSCFLVYMVYRLIKNI
jgi:hypothetical protein